MSSSTSPPKTRFLPVGGEEPPPRQSLAWIRSLIQGLTPERKASIHLPEEEQLSSLQVRVLNLSKRMGIQIQTWREGKHLFLKLRDK